MYFVGDTPESDIRFANSHDGSWHSILVKTGVYQEGTVPKYKPKHLCNDVLDAVKYAIEREHEMELAEWNETAGNDDDDKGSRINFADLMMTPSEKQEKPISTPVTSIDELEAVEVPVVLNEQIAMVKDVKVDK